MRILIKLVLENDGDAHQTAQPLQRRKLWRLYDELQEQIEEQIVVYLDTVKQNPAADHGISIELAQDAAVA